MAMASVPTRLTKSESRKAKASERCSAVDLDHRAFVMAPSPACASITALGGPTLANSLITSTQAVPMAHHSQSTIPRFPNKWAHFRFNWNFGRAEPGFWYDVGYFLTDTSLVQVKLRIDSTLTSRILWLPSANGDDADIPGIQLHNSIAIWYFDLVIFGTAVVLIYEDFDQVIRRFNPCFGELRRHRWQVPTDNLLP